ncbi:hypothetical protein [Saccharopolyspora rosea]|uniref:Uncharacterized protein n=1 Tax=Saccharopolyspora rosea TaxID=524884 RepID=A0ABW3FZW5_9PSEU|nr:hypothetical protein [Saccharopolyspora rosea]
MLRTVSRVVAICDDCGTTASDEDATVLAFADEADAFWVVTSEYGPDGYGAWSLLPGGGLVCHACYARSLCGDSGHDWHVYPCQCAAADQPSGCSELVRVCRRCDTAMTTHRDGGGQR